MTQEQKHTPGPWTFSTDSYGNWIIKSAGGNEFQGNETYYPWNSRNEAASAEARDPQALATAQEA